MSAITNIDDLKRVYHKRVPQMFYDYTESGSYTEQTFRDNSSDFNQLRPAPKGGERHLTTQHSQQDYWRDRDNARGAGASWPHRHAIG